MQRGRGGRRIDQCADFALNAGSGLVIAIHVTISSDGTIMNLAIHGGFVEVSDNVVTLLSDGAELGSEIDIERARRALERAEELTRTENSTEVEASLRRAHARLAAAGGLAGANAGH